MTQPNRRRLRLAKAGVGTLSNFNGLPASGQQRLAVSYRSNQLQPRTEITGDDSAVVFEKSSPKTADDWVRTHPRELARHQGRWIAVSSLGIVATGDSLPEVRAGAEGKGFGRGAVIVFKLPHEQLKKAVSVHRR